MAILGIHHVGLAATHAERTVFHYRDLLGLHLLERREPAPGGAPEHLLFGNQRGEPGSLLRVVVRPGAKPGSEGVGGTHHFALLVETRDLLLRWKRRLTDHGVRVSGPLDRHYFESIYHRDPDGQVIEIATRGAGWTRDEAPERIGMEHRDPPPEMIKGNRDAARIAAESWPEPVPEIGPEMRLRTLHHITAIGDDIQRTHAFVHGVLGLQLVKRTSNFDMPDSFHWYWGVGEGEPGTVVTYFERKGAGPVRHGPGQIEHFALAVAGRRELEAMRGRLRAAGFPASEVRERLHSLSVATRDPHGQVVEITALERGEGTTAEKGNG